jgi:SAM-dependent methyltransferase
MFDILAIIAVILLVLLIIAVYIGPLIQPSNPFPLASFPWHQQRVVEVLELLGSPASLNVLEIGTGYGSLSRKCSAVGSVKHYQGIELSWPLYLLTCLRRRFLPAQQQRKLDYRRGDAFKLDMRPYDVIVAYTNESFNRLLIKKLRAENKPGGWTIISIVFLFPDLKPEKMIEDKIGNVYVYKL